jgi:hypothetical protein
VPFFTIVHPELAETRVITLWNVRFVCLKTECMRLRGNKMALFIFAICRLEYQSLLGWRQWNKLRRTVMIKQWILIWPKRLGKLEVVSHLRPLDLVTNSCNSTTCHCNAIIGSPTLS